MLVELLTVLVIGGGAVIAMITIGKRADDSGHRVDLLSARQAARFNPIEALRHELRPNATRPSAVRIPTLRSPTAQPFGRVALRASRTEPRSQKDQNGSDDAYRSHAFQGCV